MSKRISNRVREDAALLCSAWACSDEQGNCGIQTIAEALGVKPQGDAWRLAWDATDPGLVPHLLGMPWREVYAEAEALVRTGWEPARGA